MCILQEWTLSPSVLWNFCDQDLLAVKAKCSRGSSSLIESLTQGLRTPTPLGELLWYTYLQEPCRLQSMGSWRVGHSRATFTCLSSTHPEVMIISQVHPLTISLWFLVFRCMISFLIGSSLSIDNCSAVSCDFGVFMGGSEVKWKALSRVQLFATLSNPLQPSVQLFQLHGILQARILEWVAFPFSRGSSQPRDQT